MLTTQESIVDYRAGRAVPDRLERSRHRHYLDYARRMLDIYAGGAGRQRRQLHRDVEAVFAAEPDCPIRRIRAFCKLLDDRSVYQTDPRGKASQLRMKVFTAGAKLHPLVAQADRLFEHEERAAKATIAEELKTPWPDIEQALYADVMSCQRMESFEGILGEDGTADAAGLLARYNVAQLQACLYRCQGMTIEATADFKTILRYAKLARLIVEARAAGPSRYRVELAGPASVLRETRRYGVNFARFLPVLLACKGWRMTAVVQTPWKGRARLVLSDRDGFTSHLPPPEEFDSAVEEAFAEKFGAERDGWRLVREGEILLDAQTVFVPDFAFRHADGTQVLMEIVGFWTPEYLAAKRKTLEQFRGQRILVAVPERSIREGAEIGPNVVVYKTGLKVEPVVEALERIRKVYPQITQIEQMVEDGSR